MNQSCCTRDKTQGEPCPPSYQAEVFNPFVGQPVPPRHSHAAGPAALRSPPAGPRRSGGGRGSGYSGAACEGGAGGDRGSKTEWKPGARRRASPGGVCVPEPGLPGAAATARAGSALRRRRPPARRSERALPVPAARGREPAPPRPPLCLRASLLLWLLRFRVSGWGPGAGPAQPQPRRRGSQRPTKMWRMLPIP